MGKLSILTKEQLLILDEISHNDFFCSQFYFTGGTALSAYYLHHRYSEDIDIFSEKKFDQAIIFTCMQEWSRAHNFTFTSRFAEVVYHFDLVFSDKTPLKIDFAYYPYKQIEKPINIHNFPTDSLVDIAINKLLTISQRTDIKDFVDLYFLLEKFTIWDLIAGVKTKFRQKIELLFLASDFLKIEDFDFLPRMVIPLEIATLKAFYREKAKEFGKMAVH